MQVLSPYVYSYVKYTITDQSNILLINFEVSLFPVETGWLSVVVTSI